MIAQLSPKQKLWLYRTINVVVYLAIVATYLLWIWSILAHKSVFASVALFVCAFVEHVTGLVIIKVAKKDLLKLNSSSTPK